MRGSVAAPLMVAAAALACAQPGTPPGGDPDNTPPRVIAVEPAAYDTLRELDEPVVIRFDERISERLQGVAELREAVLVSPATSPVKARRRSRSLEISLVRGWERSRVYTVEVQPVFRDLFGNQRVEPVRLVFSTGAPFPETALAGFVEDPLSGSPAPGVRIEARPRGEAAAFVALSDSAGFFGLRHLPAGAFDLLAWMDQDRDREADFREAQDTAVAEVVPGDTVVLTLRVLPRDTTAARLARAEPVDSLRVRLLFDDYFAVAPVTGQARVLSAGDSSLVAVASLVHGARLDAILDAEQAARDSLAAAEDTLAAAEDTLAVPADTAALPPRQAQERERERPERAGPARVPESRRRQPLLPSQELVAILPVTLTPDSAYLIRVEGVTNIRGVPGGGGVAEFVMPPPPADTADATPPDTAATGAGAATRP